MRRDLGSAAVIVAILVLAGACGSNQDPAVDSGDVTTTTATATTEDGGGQSYSIEVPGP